MRHTFISVCVWCAALHFSSSLHCFSCSSVETRATCPCVCVCVFSNWRNPVSLLRALVFTVEPRPTAQTLPYKFEKHKSRKRTRPSIYEDPRRKTHLLLWNNPPSNVEFPGSAPRLQSKSAFAGVCRQNKEQECLKALMSVLPRGSEAVKHEGIGLLHARKALHKQPLRHMGQKREGRKERERCEWLRDGVDPAQARAGESEDFAEIQYRKIKYRNQTTVEEFPSFTNTGGFSRRRAVYYP